MCVKSLLVLGNLHGVSRILEHGLRIFLPECFCHKVKIVSAAHQIQFLQRDIHYYYSLFAHATHQGPQKGSHMGTCGPDLLEKKVWGENRESRIGNVMPWLTKQMQRVYLLSTGTALAGMNLVINGFMSD